MDSELARAVGRELSDELSQAFDRIKHCLKQLKDDQVWFRPAGGLNSIGNLLLHLTGNVRQWLISGLAGTPDDRNRPAEFAAVGPIPTEELLTRLESVVREAKTLLLAQTSEDWLRVRRVQGFEVAGLGAAINSVAHFRGHTQEIIHGTRSLLGDRYRFAWVPATPEQGSPQ